MTPRRRTLLLLAGSAVAGLAGCLDDSDSTQSDGDFDGTPAENADGTPDGDADAPPDDSSSDSTEAATGERTAEGLLGQVALSTASYRVVAVQATEDPRFSWRENHPSPVSEFPEPLADALRQARDGGFETDDPSDELLTALDGSARHRSDRLSELYVRLDGTEYVAELQFPEVVIELSEEQVDEYDPDRVAAIDGEFETSEIESLVRRIGWDGTPETTRSPYRSSRITEAVAAFLDSYDYVEDHVGVSPIQVRRHNWESPVSIELRSFTPADRWGREVRDVQTLDDDLRPFLTKVIATDTGFLSPPFVTDDVPDSYFDTFWPESRKRDPPLVHVEGTVYSIYLREGSHETMPVTLSAEPASPTAEGLARFTLTISVSDDKPNVDVATGEPVQVHSQIGLPCALWISHDGESHLLNSDRYEAEVTTGNDGGSWSLAVEDPEITETNVGETLSLGDEITTTYVVPRTVPAGSYTLTGDFAALWRTDAAEREQISGSYPFEITLTLDES